MNDPQTPQAPGLRERVSAAMASVREDIVHTLAYREGHLRAVDVVDHDTAGWYGVIDATELAARGYHVAPNELAFPVPADSPSWHEAEVSGDGALFRFFAREAWLVLPETFAGAGQLSVRAPFAVNGEALESLRVAVDDVEPVEVTRGADESGEVAITLAFADLPPRAVLRVSSGVTLVPARAIPGNTDERLLSVAIKRPEWMPA